MIPRVAVKDRSVYRYTKACPYRQEVLFPRCGSQTCRTSDENDFSWRASPHGDGHAGPHYHYAERILEMTTLCPRNVNARQQRH
jgi:hypothetical protein